MRGEGKECKEMGGEGKEYERGGEECKEMGGEGKSVRRWERREGV